MESLRLDIDANTAIQTIQQLVDRVEELENEESIEFSKLEDELSHKKDEVENLEEKNKELRGEISSLMNENSSLLTQLRALGM